jgi:hypothetical protein
MSRKGRGKAATGMAIAGHSVIVQRRPDLGRTSRKRNWPAGKAFPVDSALYGSFPGLGGLGRGFDSSQNPFMPQIPAEPKRLVDQ